MWVWRTVSICIVAIVLSPAMGCARPPGDERVPWDQDGAASLAYRFVLSSLQVRPTLEVTLVARSHHPSAVPAAMSFIVPERWAGFDDLELDLTDFRAFGPDGRELVAHRSSNRLDVAAAPSDVVTLTYRVVPRARSLTSLSRFHAISTPGLFFAYGRNVLLYPSGGVDPGTRVSLVLDAPQPDSHWATTLGVFPDGSGVVEGELSQLLDAAYLGGYSRIVTLSGGPLPLSLAVDPQLSQIEDRVLGLAHRLVTFEAANFGEPLIPCTVGLLLRRADGPDILTGSGRPGGFVVEIGDGVSAEDPDLALLIAHENLHRYIGGWLTVAEGQELWTMWFTEGVVDYLSAHAVVRSGLQPTDFFLEVLAGAITGYQWNECACQTRATPASGAFWEVPALRRLSYQKGFLLAFWLDIQLRQRQDRLEGAVSQLLRAFGGHRGITNDDIRSVLQEHLGLDLTDWFGRFVVGSERLPVESWLAEAGLTMQQSREEAAYYGVKLEPRQDGAWVVTAIDPLGPAARLPLEVSDVVLGPPDTTFENGTTGARFAVSRGSGLLELWVPAQPGERIR